MHDPTRALLARLHQAAVKGAAPFPRARDAVAQWLREHDHQYPRDCSVHVIALGKASVAMAAGAIAALGNHERTSVRGVVVAAHVGDHERSMLPATLRTVVGNHPVPGPQSLEAADAIDDAVHDIDARDMVIVLLSGGTTALAAAPIAELSQAQGDVHLAQARIANLADTLLDSGLAIHEMNAIRRRVLRWGAGRLAVALAQRGVQHIPVFAISDVIGDDPAVIGSGPCTADPFDDSYFLALLDAHEVRSSLEPEMARFVGINGASRVPSAPSPSHPAFARVHYELVARNRDAIDAMTSAAREEGIEEIVVEDLPLEGNAAELGDRLARQAVHAAASTPRMTRSLYVVGGEPVVNLRAVLEHAWADSDEEDEMIARSIEDDVVETDRQTASYRDDDEPLKGGRMQLLALAASLALEESLFMRNSDVIRVHVLAAGTDGRDGPTDAAGAIVDATTPTLARRAGRRPDRDLATGRSWFSLDAAGALLRTGPTGTNVMDVVGILIDRG